MRAITCFRSTSSRGVEGSVDQVNELNLFINRFYTVAKLLLLRHSGKAAGPDGIIPRKGMDEPIGSVECFNKSWH